MLAYVALSDGEQIRVVEKETMRNGLSEANPGDKGYATAEHAPEYRPPSSMLETRTDFRLEQIARMVF